MGLLCGWRCFCFCCCVWWIGVSRSGGCEVSATPLHSRKARVQQTKRNDTKRAGWRMDNRYGWVRVDSMCGRLVRVVDGCCCCCVGFVCLCVVSLSLLCPRFLFVVWLGFFSFGFFCLLRSRNEAQCEARRHKQKEQRNNKQVKCEQTQ